MFGLTMTKRSLNCGVCNTLKVEKRNRLVCPECNRRYAREAIERNGKRPITEAVRATKKRYKEKVRDTGLTNDQAYRLKHLYGISDKDYLDLKMRQGSRCGICKELLTKEALVDHNHDSGFVRGLLCRQCNFGLGLFCDDLQRLKSAITYLENSKQRETDCG